MVASNNIVFLIMPENNIFDIESESAKSKALSIHHPSSQKNFAGRKKIRNDQVVEAKNDGRCCCGNKSM